MTIKKIVILAGLFCIGVVNVLFYCNARHYHRAMDVEDLISRIEALAKANKYLMFNDKVYYETGKSHFDLFRQNLGDKAVALSHLQKAAENFNLSLKINPASPFGHFHMAQSLLYLDVCDPSSEDGFMQEFKSAVNLAGDNHEMFYEVGKVFLSRWPFIAEEDKISTIHILKKSLQEERRDKFLPLLPIWEMNVRDYSVIRQIIPKKPDFYHMYARFLGEKSLSLEERRDVLVEAEFLDFEHARMRHESGKAFLFAYQFEKAQGQFRICLNILKRIRFYQDLTGQNLIDIFRFETLQKLANLDMATSILGNRGEWSEARKFLIPYLEREDRIAEVKKIEDYLHARNLLPKKIEDSIRDMSELYLHLLIYAKQKRYRDVTAIGSRLFEDVRFLTKGNKEDTVQALLVVGDSFEMTGSQYRAVEYYWKALEISPASLETMVRIRNVLPFTGEEIQRREIQTRIDRILSRSPLRFENLEIKKGQDVSRRLFLDGQQISLNLHLGKIGEGDPLVSVHFNGRVIWDGPLEDENLSFALESKIGENFIQIQAVESPVFWKGIDYKKGD